MSCSSFSCVFLLCCQRKQYPLFLSALSESPPFSNYFRTSQHAQLPRKQRDQKCLRVHATADGHRLWRRLLELARLLANSTPVALVLPAQESRFDFTKAGSQSRSSSSTTLPASPKLIVASMQAIQRLVIRVVLANTSDCSVLCLEDDSMLVADSKTK